MRSSLFNYLGFLILFVTIPSYGIINIESLRLTKSSSALSSSASFKFDKKEGNSNTSEYLLGVQTRYNGENIQHLAFLDAKYGESQDIKNANRYTAHYRYAFDTNNILSKEIYTQLESDEFTRLSFRSLLGVGVRQPLEISENQKLYLGLGGFYSIEKLDSQLVSPTEDLEYENTRWNIYLTYLYTLDSNIKLLLINYWQPLVDSTRDYRWLSDNSLEFSINNHLSLALVYIIRRDSQPPTGVKELDQNYGTVIKFNF